MRPTHRFAELGLAFVCLLWGSTFVVVKKALDDISPALFVGIRFSIATILLAGVYFSRSRSGARPWLGGIVTGIFLYTGYFLQTLGLRFTSPAKSGFLTGLYIVLVPLLTAAVYQKAPGLSEWFGVSLAMVGLGLMTLTTMSFDIGAGDALTIGCAFAFAIHMLLLAKYSPRMQTEWLALVQIGTCAALALATCPVLEAPFVRWNNGVLIALAVTAVFSTALAFLIQTWGQRYTTATRAALIFSLEPVFAWLTSYLVEGEVLTGQVLAGAGCILGGILCVELKPLQRRSDSES